MADLNLLAEKVACHLAGRPVTVRWENPPSQSAAGQIVRTWNDELIIYVGNLTGAETRYRVLIHEIAHAKLDAAWVPKSSDHLKPPNSIKRTEQARETWRKHPREIAVKALADYWIQYAEKRKYDYWQVGRPDLQCRLLALLEL